MAKYRIYTGRFDIRETVYMEFEAPTDAAAATKFAAIAAEPSNAWDNMRVICIDKPAIAEVSHHVAYNENMVRYLK